MDGEKTLYRTVAERIRQAIENGVYRPGERVPSLRKLADSLSVSINTVREAYLFLESRGILAVRPQTGFFVQAPLEIPRHPAADRPAPQEATVPDIIRQLLADSVTPGLISLAIAEADPDMLPVRDLEHSLVRAIRTRPSETLAYQFEGHTLALRRHIARRLLTAHVEAHPDEIVVTSGCLEAVSLALMTVCARGDTLAIESPAYFIFFQLAERLGLRVVEIPTDPPSGMRLDVLEYVYAHHEVKAVLCTPNFHNPTGSLMPEDQKRRLVEMSAAAGVTVIEDDVSGDLCFDLHRPPSLASYDRDGTVIHCGSFSKTITPGARVGWMFGQRWRGEIAQLKVVGSVSVAAPSVQAITEYLDTGRYDRHLRKLRTSLQDNTYRMIGQVGREFPRGTRITQPAGGLTLWVELPPDIDVFSFYNAARRRGISVAIGPLFTLSRDFRQFIRLTTGRFRAAEAVALTTLGELLRSHKYVLEASRPVDNGHSTRSVV